MCVATVGLDPRLHGRHGPRAKFVAQWRRNGFSA